MFANLLSFFFNHKNAQPLIFLHLSTSGTVNNIKIICSIRFSLLITINRFYKLFLAEGAFVNRRSEMIFPLFFIPLSPSNLRPFGAPPSRGRRECPREPLPLEGAAERSEAGLASFLGRHSGALVNDALETIFFALFHTARTLSGSLRSPPSPRGEGFVRRYSFSPRILYSL